MEPSARFIGVIKTETRKFLIAYLSNIEFQNRGDISGLLTRPVYREKPVLGAFIWMDQNRRYFIFIGVSMEKGRLHTRILWKQEGPSPNTELNMVELNIPHPIIAEIYYISCGQIGRHNRSGQEFLTSKKSWVLKIGQSSSTYLFLRIMWLMSGWHTKASLGRRRPKMVNTIICLKR